MRASQLFAPTIREVPAEAELVSHALLLRAGFIRRLSAGIYSYLPLGWRVLRKIAQIVREEMDREGAQEVFLPAVHPAELWKETGRYEEYGDVLAKLRDRQGREHCLGPTHEEVITDIIRREVKSYRDLPVMLYQIQTKFRDEPRPRGGLMRGREFLMKDAYSFDRDEEGLKQSYQAMYRAYCRIFTRCGLTYTVVEAEAGAIGGTENLEFMVVSESGEDKLLRCPSCGYAANHERAQRRPPSAISHQPSAISHQPLQKVSTPNQKTVEQVTRFLGVTADRLVKTLLYVADGSPSTGSGRSPSTGSGRSPLTGSGQSFVAALIRGDEELNEAKLRRFLSASQLRMANADEILSVTGAPVGYTGPVGLKGVRIVADYDLASMQNFVTGANEDDAHLINVNIGRDFAVDDWADLRFARTGDGCIKCDGTLSEQNCIEVGHIFQLGTRYSEPMKATFVDEDGREKFILMGCYGIGVSRILATIVEVSHDDDGIIWPISVAPYEAWIVPVEAEDPQLKEAAERIYTDLQKAGIEVVIDDRSERPGVKFKDADLIGCPIQVIIGRHVKESGQAEVRLRRDRKAELVPVAQVSEHVAKLREQLMAAIRHQLSAISHSPDR